LDLNLRFERGGGWDDKVTRGQGEEAGDFRFLIFDWKKGGGEKRWWSEEWWGGGEGKRQKLKGKGEEGRMLKGGEGE
jgi:hypothetical protein